MVVERGALLDERPFQGFSPAPSYDYESLILKHYRYAPRADAEEDPSLKQPIAYCIIVNSARGLLFIYRRAEGDYDEARLRGKWSVGIGGHIDRADLSERNPIRASMLRELGEEIKWKGPLEPRILGYINDDIDMVGKVHFGLLYLLDTDEASLEPATREIAETRMIPLAEWRRMLDDPGCPIEGWSRIASAALLENLGPPEGS
jgi:predicted NUDIX family phosphoesterase